MSNHTSVVVLSGGLDSTVLLHHVMEDSVPAVLSFNYGQRHSKELDYATRTCNALGLLHHVVDLTPLKELLHSSLTYTTAVPEGHYAEDSMKATIVPNRNAIMLSIAYGWALSLEASRIYIGAHDGDHAIYPDCRAEFFDQLNSALNLGSSWSKPIQIVRPFQHRTKADIVTLGHQLKVPFDLTWSCYQGGEVHCGRCGTCVERAEAFAKAQVMDPTTYADPAYWRTATAVPV